MKNHIFSHVYSNKNHIFAAKVLLFFEICKFCKHILRFLMKKNKKHFFNRKPLRAENRLREENKRKRYFRKKHKKTLPLGC